MVVLTVAGMREADAAACDLLGQTQLMRNAGDRCAELAAQYARSPRIVAFAGRGNNGGDAFATLAALPNSFERVVYADPSEGASQARRDAEHRAHEAGVTIHDFPKDVAEAHAALDHAGLVVEGLLGTGARLPVPPAYATAIEAMNACEAPVLALDIPTGIDADTGEPNGPAVHATATVTLGALKVGLLLSTAREYCGELWLADIGMPAQTLDHAPYAALNDREFVAMLPKRAGDTDKRRAGAPLVIAGSQQFPGAAILCALGAARAGAGYVTVATPPDAAPALRTHLIEQVVVTFNPDKPKRSVEDLLDVAKRCSSAGIGPGLGLQESVGEIVREFVRRSDLPIVADASALFHFAKNLEMLRDKKIVLTPHEGEFARLSGKGTIKSGERMTRLREFVDRTGITTLLKGQATLVYDGATMHVNTTGTSALATAGTGDVLTGVIATLLSQGLSPVDAARVGAYWHGLAARRAAQTRRVGVIARDVYENLASALPHPEDDASKTIRIY